MGRLFVAVALALVPLAGCATLPKVSAISEPGSDFTHYRSFGFHQPLGTDQGGYQTIVTEGLKAAVRQQMEARGLSYAETDPDLVVNFSARLDRRLMRSIAPAGGIGGFGGRGYYRSWGGYHTVAIPYEEGTLNIDIVDRARRQLVWEGVVSETVKSEHLQQLAPELAKAVAAAFTRYPAPAPMPAALPAPAQH